MDWSQHCHLKSVNGHDRKWQLALLEGQWEAEEPLSSATLDISLGCLGTTFVASSATFIHDTEVAEDFGIESMTTGVSGMVAIMKRF